MTNEEAKSELMQLYGMLSEEKKQALDVLMAQAEKTCDIEKSNFDVRQYKLDTDTAYECGYNAGLQAQADGEYIPKQAVLENIDQWYEDKADIEDLIVKITYMPSVAIPNKAGHWIVRDDLCSVRYYQCSECNELCLNDTNFCPNCGAKMD